MTRVKFANDTHVVGQRDVNLLVFALFDVKNRAFVGAFKKIPYLCRLKCIVRQWQIGL